MKKMIIGAILCTVMLSPAMAQKQEAGVAKKQCCEQMTAQDRALQKATRMKKTLELTDDQYNKVYKAYQKRFEKQEKDKAAFEKKMSKILNEVQYAQWQESGKKACCKKDAPRGRGPQEGGPGFEKGPRPDDRRAPRGPQDGGEMPPMAPEGAK